MHLYKFFAPASLAEADKEALKSIDADTLERIDAKNVDVQVDDPNGEECSAFIPTFDDSCVLLAFSNAVTAYKETLPDDVPYKATKGMSLSLDIGAKETCITIQDNVVPLLS